MSESLWIERVGGAFAPFAARSVAPNKTVLVVDDEDIVRALSRRALARKGYAVIEASNGEEALALFEREEGRIDLVVTDIMMPGMSGLELARQVLGRSPRVQVLYMSASSEGLVRRWCGGQRHEFLQKPFLMEGLSRKVGDMLAG
jgi:CheY-like chemotaxis protein